MVQTEFSQPKPIATSQKSLFGHPQIPNNSTQILFGHLPNPQQQQLPKLQPIITRNVFPSLPFNQQHDSPPRRHLPLLPLFYITPTSSNLHFRSPAAPSSPINTLASSISALATVPPRRHHQWRCLATFSQRHRLLLESSLSSPQARSRRRSLRGEKKEGRVTGFFALDLGLIWIGFELDHLGNVCLHESGKDATKVDTFLVVHMVVL